MTMRVDRVGAERHDATLGPAADRPRQVQQRAGRRPPGRMNRRSGGSSCSRRSIVCSSRSTRLRVTAAFVTRAGDARRRVGQPGADGEQLLLNRLDDRLLEIHVVERRPRGAEAGVELVDLAVGVDARVGLRHARVVEERRLAAVAGLCVDLHRVKL